MTITIGLPDDTMALLRAEAAQQGRPAEDVAAERLALLYKAQDNSDTILAEASATWGAGGNARPFPEFLEEFRARLDN